MKKYNKFASIKSQFAIIKLLFALLLSFFMVVNVSYSTSWRTDLQGYQTEQRNESNPGLFVTEVKDVPGFSTIYATPTGPYEDARNCTPSEYGAIKVYPKIYLYYPLLETTTIHENEKSKFPGVICSKSSSWIIDLVVGDPSPNNSTASGSNLVKAAYELMKIFAQKVYTTFLTLVAIYFMFYGFQFLQGKGDLLDMFKKFLFLFVLLVLIRDLRDDNGGTYKSIMGWIFNVHNFLLGISFATPDASGPEPAATLSSMIDGMHSYNDAFATAMWHSNYTKLGGWGDFKVFWAGPVVATVMKLTGMFALWAATEPLLMSKVFLIILAVPGPIFLSLYMFGPTRKFTEQWISELIEQLFTALLLGIVLKLLLIRTYGASVMAVGNISANIAGGAAGGGASIAGMMMAGMLTNPVTGTVAGVVTAAIGIGAIISIGIQMSALNTFFGVIIKNTNRIAAHLTGGFGIPDMFANAATNQAAKLSAMVVAAPIAAGAGAAAMAGAGAASASAGAAAGKAASDAALAAGASNAAAASAGSQATAAASSQVGRAYFARSLETASSVFNNVSNVGEKTSQSAIGGKDASEAVTAVGQAGFNAFRGVNDMRTGSGNWKSADDMASDVVDKKKDSLIKEQKDAMHNHAFKSFSSQNKGGELAQKYEDNERSQRMQRENSERERQMKAQKREAFVSNIKNIPGNVANKAENMANKLFQVQEPDNRPQKDNPSSKK